MVVSFKHGCSGSQGAGCLHHPPDAARGRPYYGTGLGYNSNIFV